MRVEPLYAPSMVLRPPRVPPGKLRRVPAEFWGAAGWAVLALALAVAFGTLIWWAGDLAWGLLGLVVFLPRFVDSLLVLAGILGVAALSPLMDWLGSVPEIAKYWPLALAALVPVPLALLVEAVFFRR